MRNSITSILSAFALCCSMNAQAQYSATVDQYPASSYKTSAVEFSLAEVAPAMGYASAEEFATAYTASARANEEKATFDGAIFFTCTDTLGVQQSNYTQGGFGGFWMNEQGQIVEWGDKAFFYNQVAIDSVDNVPTSLVFYLGQYPSHCEANKTYATTITMGNGTKSVTFDLAIKVNELPVIEATPVLSKLTIKGTTEASIEEYPRGTYTASELKFSMAEGIQALGIPSAVLEADLQTRLYSYQLDKELDVIKDSLTNTSTANSGYWLSPTYDPNTGDPTNKCFVDQYGANNLFFIEGFSFSAASDSATCQVGQNPGTLKVGDAPYAELYLINGTDAWKYILTLNIVKEPIPDEVIEVGREVVEITKKPSTSGNYDAKDYKLDEAKMVELLGGDPNSWVFKHNNTDNHSTNYTTSATGFWMDIDGNICSWKSSVDVAAVYVDYSAPATLTIGQYPDKNKDGDKFHTILEVVNVDKAYTIDLTINFQAGEPVKEFKNLATYELDIQDTIPAKAYTTITSEALDMAAIYELIGTNEPEHYTIAVPDSGATTMQYSNSFTCTPYPGFWYNKDGQNGGWGGNPFVGLTFSATNGNYDVYLYPDAGGPVVGDTFKTNWFFVNEATGDMVTVIINVNIVEELIEREDVGAESTMVVLTDPEEEASQTLNLSEAMTKLEAESVSDFYENGTLLAAVNSSSFGGGSFYDEAEGFWFDANGYVIDPANETQLESQAFSVNIFIEEDGTATITTYCLVPPAEGQMYTTRLSLNYGSKRYIITVNIADEATASGIATVNGENVKANVYDLSGRIVRKNANSVEGLNRGIYILNGKKVLVK